MTLNMPTIMIGVLFGLIGFAAWRYGRRELSGRHMILGAALMGFGYLIPNPWAACAVGLILIILLFWP